VTGWQTRFLALGGITVPRVVPMRVAPFAGRDGPPTPRGYKSFRRGVSPRVRNVGAGLGRRDELGNLSA